MNANDPADGQRRPPRQHRNPAPPRAGVPASRRSVLAIGLGLLGLPALAACDVNVRVQDFGPAPTLTPGADELSRRAVVTAILAAQESARRLGPDDKQGYLDGTLAEQLAGLGGPAGATPAAPPATAGAPPSTPREFLDAATAIGVAAAAQMPLASGPLARRLAALMAGGHVLASQFADDASLPRPAAPKIPAAGTDGAPSSDAPAPTGSAVPSGATSDAPSDAAATALAQYLRGLQAAIYGYEVLTVRLDGDERKRATDRTAQLEALGGGVASELRAASADVPAPQPGYVLPAPVDNAGDARGLAAELESRLADLAGAVVAAAPPSGRAVPGGRLLDSALAAWAWSGDVEALPGAGDGDAAAPTVTPNPTPTPP